MTCSTIERLWHLSPEGQKALGDYLDRTLDWQLKDYSNSPEFRNARLAFRRRMNKSPDSETT